jgi:hypothetical protein
MKPFKGKGIWRDADSQRCSIPSAGTAAAPERARSGELERAEQYRDIIRLIHALLLYTGAAGMSNKIGIFTIPLHPAIRWKTAKNAGVIFACIAPRFCYYGSVICPLSEVKHAEDI